MRSVLFAPVLSFLHLSPEEEWEKELEAELQDFEVVADGDKSNAQWESQIEEMLDADDLKPTKWKVFRVYSLLEAYIPSN